MKYRISLNEGFRDMIFPVDGMTAVVLLLCIIYIVYYGYTIIDVYNNSGYLQRYDELSIVYTILSLVANISLMLLVLGNYRLFRIFSAVNLKFEQRMASGFKITAYGFLILAVIPLPSLYFSKYYFEWIIDTNSIYFMYYNELYNLVFYIISITAVIMIAYGYLYIVTARYYYENNTPPNHGAYRSKVLFVADLRRNVMSPPDNKRDQIIVFGFVGIFLWIIVIIYYFVFMLNKYDIYEGLNFEIFYYSTNIGTTIIGSIFYIIIVLCIYRVYKYYQRFRTEFDAFFSYGWKLLFIFSMLYWFIFHAAITPLHMLTNFVWINTYYSFSEEYLESLYMNDILLAACGIVITLLMLYSLLLLITSMRFYRPRIRYSKAMKQIPGIPPEYGRTEKVENNTEDSNLGNRKDLIYRHRF